MIRTRLALAIARPRLSLGGALPVLVAHAVAFAAVSHCHYWMRPPNRVEWLAAELILGSLLWLLVRKLVLPLVARVRQANAGRAALAVGVGLALWWHGQIADTLWVLDPAWRPLLDGCLFVSHAVVAGLAFAGLVILVATTDGPIRPSEPVAERSRWRWLAPALFAVAAVVIAVAYVRQEQTIYLADWMYQWTLAADWSRELRRSLPAAWDQFRVSVQHGGYTLLPGTPPAAVMAVLGDSRAAFVGAVAAIYLTATYVAVVAFTRRTTSAAPRLFTAVFLLTMPLAWLPVWQGYPDLGGVPLAILSLALMAGRPREQLRWPHLFGTAAVLVTMVLFRRWYSFWAVGLIAVAVADGVLAAVPMLLARKPREAWRAVRPAGVLAVLFPLLLAAVALPMFPTLVGTNANTLAGYRHPGALHHRLWLTGYVIGFGYFGLAGAAAVYLLGLRPTRRPTLFLLGVSAVMVPLFYRMQDPNRHHEYLALPLLALLPAMAVARLPRRAAGLAVLAVAGLGTVNLLGSVDPGWKAVRERHALLASNWFFPPAVRSDRAAFERLLQFLNAETERTGKPFVALAGSQDLHWSMFQAAERSLGVPFPAAKFLLPTADVDRVTGFPDGLFLADLVLVPDPPQFVLRAEEQQTLLLPARLLAAREGIGASFERLPERFALQNGVTVTFYRRTRPIPPSDVHAFREALRLAHPDDPHVFESRRPAEELTKMP